MPAPVRRRPRLPTALALAVATFAPFAFAQGGGDDGSSVPGQLDPVTVRARRAFDDRFQSTAATITVDRQDIDAMGVNSVGDILRQLPGLQVTPTANGGLEIRMRGMAAQNTRILLDGAPLSTSNRNQQLPFDELPADLIERIEVHRSPTAEFEGAAGGTINVVLRPAGVRRETIAWIGNQRVWGMNGPTLFVSQTGPLGESPADQRGGNARERNADAVQRNADAGPRNADPGERGVDAAQRIADADRARWSYFVSLAGGTNHHGSDTRRESSTGGSAPASNTVLDEVGRLDSTQWTLMPRLNGRLSATDQVTIRGMLNTITQDGLVSTDGHTDTASGTSTTALRTPWTWSRRFGQIAFDWTHRLRSAKLDASLGWERNDSAYRFDRTSATTVAGATTQRVGSLSDDRRERAWQMRAKLAGPLGDALWTLGTELDERRLSVASASIEDGLATPLDVEATVRRTAFWGQYEQPLARHGTTLVGGLRAQGYDTDTRSPAGRIGQLQWYWQPSLGARTRLDDDWQLRGNLARISRVPRVWELLARPVPSNATNAPNTPDFVGNAGLRPETTLSLDVGVDRRLANQGQAGVNLFVRDQHEVIGRRLFVQAGRWTEMPDNVGDALVWGLEADLRGDPGWAGLSRQWTLSANASLLQSRMRSGEAIGQRIPGQARYLANVTLARPLRVSGGWYGGATLSLTGSSDQDQPSAAGATVNGGQRARARLDVYVGSVIAGLGFWRLNLNNVTDFRSDTHRTAVDANGVVYSDRAVQRLTPRVILTVGTRF